MKLVTARPPMETAAGGGHGGLAKNSQRPLLAAGSELAGLLKEAVHPRECDAFRPRASLSALER
jgi:hypothetical protein